MFSEERTYFRLLPVIFGVIALMGCAVCFVETSKGKRLERLIGNVDFDRISMKEFVESAGLHWEESKVDVLDQDFHVIMIDYDAGLFFKIQFFVEIDLEEGKPEVSDIYSGEAIIKSVKLTGVFR